MDTLRLLIVEDDKEAIEACRLSRDKYTKDKDIKIELVECKSLDESLGKLDNTFDGAIIDLTLKGKGEEGNQVIKTINESFFRIPVAVYTGNPNSVDETFPYIGIYIKGKDKYKKIFDALWGIYNTGITRIMGGRGMIEEKLAQVFSRIIHTEQREPWVSYGKEDKDRTENKDRTKKDKNRTEKAMLRHVINHLFQLLDNDNDNDKFFPEEVYIYPATGDVTTGRIVKNKDDNKYYVVLSPACDLVVRNGKCKTNNILLVAIDTDELGIGKDDMKNARNNNYKFCYHWLPPTKFFINEGLIDFRKLKSWDKNKFAKEFHPPYDIQISPFFVKDIVARFAAYYGRQGQPEIDISSL